MYVRVIVAGLLLCLPQGAGAQGTVHAFTNVAVIPMDRERVLANQTVVVRSGRVVAMGDARRVRVPAGATRVDGTGRFLIPGLADMHVHMFDRNELTAYLANGITTVRNLHGIPRHLAWRDSIARGAMLGPRLYTSGAIIDGSPPTRATNVVVRTAAEAERVVAEQKAAGYDFIKIYDNVPRDLYAVIIAAARRAGLTVSGHLPTPVGLAGLLEVRGQKSIEHIEELLPLFRDGRDTALVDSVARSLARAAVWVVPTITVHASALAQGVNGAAVAARPELRYMNPATMRDWGWEPSAAGFAQAGARERFARTVGFFERTLLPALHRAGVGILAGTDAPIPAIIPGFSLVDELRTFVRAGLTPFEALATATRAPAEFLGASGEWGTIAVGRSGDLVLLDRNPLEDIGAVARPAGVMVRGRWLPRKELDRMLEEIAARYRN